MLSLCSQNRKVRRNFRLRRRCEDNINIDLKKLCSSCSLDSGSEILLAFQDALLCCEFIEYELR